MGIRLKRIETASRHNTFVKDDSSPEKNTIGGRFMTDSNHRLFHYVLRSGGLVGRIKADRIVLETEVFFGVPTQRRNSLLFLMHGCCLPHGRASSFAGQHGRHASKTKSNHRHVGGYREYPPFFTNLRGIYGNPIKK